MSAKIIWIASYPKSGNTWMRFLLCNYFFNSNNKFNIEIIKKIRKFPSDLFLRPFLTKSQLISDPYCTPPYWIKAQQNIQTSDNAIFLKTHNAMCKLNGDLFTNEILSHAIIYIVRDPRDLVISNSYFTGNDFDQTISFMTSKKMVYRNSEHKKLFVPEFIGSWSFNYNSWNKTLITVPKIFIKYEDLLKNTTLELKKVIEFLSKIINFKVDHKKIDMSVDLSKFDKLKKYEQKKGFIESSDKNIFFRKGEKNQWKNQLSNTQIKKIENEFKKEMKFLGYLF